jgi:uncharacterized protein (DUF427 family)
MGLSWQQGPLSGVSLGRFLTPEPLPKRLLFVEPLRRRLRVKLADEWIADTEHPDFGVTQWFTATVGDHRATRGAWRFTALPGYATDLHDHVAFAWRAMDAFYEEDDRIVGHAADAYHRIDIRHSSRHLVVKDGVKAIADTKRPLALYESGFAPRWYVPRQDVDEKALVPAQGQTFCPYKGLCSFEPDQVDVFLDNNKLALEPGQNVVPHGMDRGLDPDEILKRDAGTARS